MDIEINKNGETYRLEDYGIHAKDFIVSSIPLETLNDVLEGRSGTVDYGASFGSRTIKVPFIMQSKDLLDFPLLRDFLFSIVVSKEPFYIRERRRKKYQAYDFVDTNEKAKDDEESQNNFVGGKRYKVRLQDSFDIDQSLEYGEGEFIFETTDLPFAESIGTTADIDQIELLSNQSFTQGYWVNIIGGNNTAILSTTVRTVERIEARGNVEYEVVNRSTEADLIISMYNSSGYKKRIVISPNEGNDYAERHTFTTDDDIVLIGVHFSTVSTTGYNISVSDIGDTLKGTLKKRTGGINSEDELWGFGMGLIANDSSLIYTHTGTAFRVFNAGNVPVHPFEQDLKITISNVQGSSEYLQLENKTTGDVFKVNEAVSNNDVIVIDGANITKNSLQFLRSTNKQFIELEKEWNQFEIKGATNAKVSFDMRFYYL